MDPNNPRDQKEEYDRRVENLKSIYFRLQGEDNPISRAAAEAVQDTITEVGRELSALARIYPSIF